VAGTQEGKKGIVGCNLEKGDAVEEDGRVALSLFSGMDAIFDSITQEVCAKLQQEDSSEISALENEAGLESGTLIAILKEHKKVDKHVYKRIKNPLRLSIKEALRHNFLKDELAKPAVKSYWEKELCENPMRLAVPCGGDGVLPEHPITLELYVAFRAMGEFYRGLL
jgi:hypothetical protein